MKKSELGVGRYGVFILLMLVPFAQAIAQHTTNDILAVPSTIPPAE
jgi:hypothetical protein